MKNEKTYIVTVELAITIGEGKQAAQNAESAGEIARTVLRFLAPGKAMVAGFRFEPYVHVIDSKEKAPA